jgi:hypothetical protein
MTVDDVLLTTALTILDALDSGDLKTSQGQCKTCAEHRGVFYEKRQFRLTQRGLCVDCLFRQTLKQGNSGDS